MKRASVYGTPARRQLWRIVEGAVADAFKSHPEYLTPAGRRWAQQSVTKRVVGSVQGFAAQTAEGRSRSSRAAEQVPGESFRPDQAAEASAADGASASTGIGGGPAIDGSPESPVIDGEA